MFMQNSGGTNKEYLDIFESGLLIKSPCDTEHNRGDIMLVKMLRKAEMEVT